jgi:acyl dehydratase
MDSTMRERVYFEDLEPGRTWEWGEYVVTKEEIIEFASKYDPQPFHLDDAAALASVFQGFAASSVHTIALENRMFHLHDGPRFMALAQLAMTDLAFPAPVMAGDRLRIIVQCLSRRESQSKPDRGVVVEQCALLNQRDVECFRCTHTVLVPKRAA